jgi:hypothetical protein
VAVEPARDAEDAWLTIATDRGRHYMIHLVPVARDDSSAQRLVAYYYWHPPVRLRARRQAVPVATRARRRRQAVPVAIRPLDPGP